MKDEDRTTAYGIGAILVVLAVTIGLIAQELWLVALSLMMVTLWVAIGFIYDLWKDDDE
jgi:hypothetical protein|nr:MAG TPA: hypothetical protein [Caudoviricetes sp.]